MIKLLVVIAVVAWSILIRLVPGLAPVAVTLPDGACSENAAYAEVSIAAIWLEDHPPSIIYAQRYGYAELKTLYDQLLADGTIDPAPPACVVAARFPAVIHSRPDHAADRTGALLAGDTADIYGRSADGTWWYINSRTGWGWVSARAVIVQPAADVSLIPLRG